MGAAYRALSQLEPALGFYQQALIIRREAGDRLGEINTLANIGTIYVESGKKSRGLAFYAKAWSIADQLGNHTLTEWLRSLIEGLDIGL